MNAYKRQIALTCANEVIVAFDNTLLQFMSVILVLISAIEFMFLCGTFAQSPKQLIIINSADQHYVSTLVLYFH